MTTIDFSLSSSDGFRQGEDFPTPALNGLWKAQFEVMACCQVLLGRTVWFSQGMGEMGEGSLEFHGFVTVSQFEGDFPVGLEHLSSLPFNSLARVGECGLGPTVS